MPCPGKSGVDARKKITRSGGRRGGRAAAEEIRRRSTHRPIGAAHVQYKGPRVDARWSRGQCIGRQRSSPVPRGPDRPLLSMDIPTAFLVFWELVPPVLSLSPTDCACPSHSHVPAERHRSQKGAWHGTMEKALVQAHQLYLGCSCHFCHSRLLSAGVGCVWGARTPRRAVAPSPPRREGFIHESTHERGGNHPGWRCGSRPFRVDVRSLAASHHLFPTAGIRPAVSTALGGPPARHRANVTRNQPA